jgi:hypothetical protein
MYGSGKQEYLLLTSPGVGLLLPRYGILREALALLGNVIISLEVQLRTNTLAYLSAASAAKIKKF